MKVLVLLSLCLFSVIQAQTVQCAFELHTVIYTTNQAELIVPEEDSPEEDVAEVTSAPPATDALLTEAPASTNATETLPTETLATDTPTSSTSTEPPTSTLPTEDTDISETPPAAETRRLQVDVELPTAAVEDGPVEDTPEETPEETPMETPTEMPSTPPVETPAASVASPMPAVVARAINIMDCDSALYSRWALNNITCDGAALDVASAVAAASCSIYSGEIVDSFTNTGDVESCLQVCRFPQCVAGVWDYSSDNGINSYGRFDLIALLGDSVGEYVANTVSGAVAVSLREFEFEADEECAALSDLSTAENLGACECPESLGGKDKFAGTRSQTVVTNAGAAAAKTGSGAATVTVGASIAIVISTSSSTVSTVSTAATAAAGSSIATFTIDVCQFTSMLGLLVETPPDATGDKNPEAEILSNFSRTFSATSFIWFSSLGPYNETAATTSFTTQDGSSSTSSSNKAMDSGVASYSKRLGIDPNALFYVTLAGIGALAALIMVFYLFLLLLVLLCGKSVKEYAVKWWDNVIGFYVLMGILTQYVIGVTATFQIYTSIESGQVSIALFVAIGSLVFLALGIIFYGVLVVKKNERQLRDVGTFDHTKKAINKRYGALYDEYNFDNRYFFAPKMTLALISGITTGLSLIEPVVQVAILLAMHIGFLFFLEMRRPYHTKFLQNTASLVTVMKISALVLTFFLISSLGFFPENLQKIVAYIVIAIQLGVLVCLMIRQLYIVFKRYKEGQEDKKRMSDSGGRQTVLQRDEDGSTLAGNQRYYSAQSSYGPSNSYGGGPSSEYSYGDESSMYSDEDFRPARDDSSSWNLYN